MQSTSHRAATASYLDYSANRVIPVPKSVWTLLNELRIKLKALPLVTRTYPVRVRPTPASLSLSYTALLTLFACCRRGDPLCVSEHSLSLRAAGKLPSPGQSFLQLFPCLAPACHLDLTLDVSSSHRYPVPLWGHTSFISQKQPISFISRTLHLLTFFWFFVCVLTNVHMNHWNRSSTREGTKPSGLLLYPQYPAQYLTAGVLQMVA